MVITRVAIRPAISRPASASIRVQPVSAITTALMITATDPRASLTTSKKAARMLRFAPRPELSTSIETMLPTSPHDAEHEQPASGNLRGSKQSSNTLDDRIHPHP